MLGARGIGIFAAMAVCGIACNVHRLENRQAFQIPYLGTVTGHGAGIFMQLLAGISFRKQRNTNGRNAW